MSLLGIERLLQGVLDDDDFRARTTFLAMKVLHERYRDEETIH